MDLKKIPSPSYVIDELRLRKNLSLIESVSKEAKVNIIIAFKGFSAWGAFDIIKEYVNQASASSLNEARLAYTKIGSKAHTYSPVYNPSEFSAILECSSHITFNSLNQYKLYKNQVLNYEHKISMGLRVNPEYSEVTTDLYNPTHPTSRLGINALDLKELPEGIEGLHFHALCESNSYTLEKTLESLENKFSHLLKQVKWVNMGGGHLMTHADYNCKHLIAVLKAFKEKYNVEIILEPGAAFVWQTGFLIADVLDIIENGGIKTAMLNVSFTAHMPDCLEMPYQPKINKPANGENGQYSYRLGGNSCLAGDYMGDWHFEKPLKEGDKIVFDDMIHYTMVKTTMFNGVQHPNIGIWKRKNFYMPIRQFGFEDYLQRMS